MKPLGHFVWEAALTFVEAAIYEERMGIAETNIHSLRFDSGESLNIKIKSLVKVEEVEVKEENEEGRVTIGAGGSGTLQFFDENQETLFEGEWQMDITDTRLVIDNNLISELVARGTYTAVGINRYAGHIVSGEMVLVLSGLDESGMGIYKIQGEGTIQQTPAD